MSAAGPAAPAATPPRDERLHWLRLIRSEHVGPVTFWRLIETYGSATRALEVLPELARRGGRAQAPRIPSVAEAEAEVAAHAAAGVHLVAANERRFPSTLRAIPDCPPVLAVRGHVGLLEAPAIAIVGGRAASLNGTHMAALLAADLAAVGYVIVSGLALGIDTAAHRAALPHGTIGVAAGGVDHPYPRENAGLYQAMAEGGAIVSELPIGTVPRAQHFPRRNRIIAGLARAVVVVEAALRSGSLITARHALDYGREVMAVPGNPLDDRCHGANQLIREGARLVQSAADVLEDLGPVLHGPDPMRPPPRPPSRGRPRPLGQAALAPPPAAAADDDPAMARARERILQLLGADPVTVDDLVRAGHISAAGVQRILVELDLAGRLDRQSGDRVALRPPP